MFPRLLYRTILLLACGSTLLGAEEVIRIGVERNSEPLS